MQLNLILNSTRCAVHVECESTAGVKTVPAPSCFYHISSLLFPTPRSPRSHLRPVLRIILVP